MVGCGVKEAEERHPRAASKCTWRPPVVPRGNHQLTATRTGMATQLALAYAIHKSFIFVRVPLAAVVTPRVVKVLRGWGWQIGKQKAKR